MALKVERLASGAFAVIEPDPAGGRLGDVIAEYDRKAEAEAHVQIAAKGASFDQIRQRLQAWAQSEYPPKRDGDGYPAMSAWVMDVFPDRFIYCEPDGRSYERAYALVGSELTVGEPQEVRQTWEAVKSAAAPDTLVWQGDAVKALGGGRVGGYLVRFSDETAPDSSPERDFFTAQTDYGVDFPASSPVLYHHGQDDALKKRRLGRGEMKADEVGVWIEAQLNLRDDYEKAVYRLAEAGKMGWSSGTANHLVEREAVTKDGRTVAHRVTSWPLGLDASLTPIPAEPRNQAVALKSLSQPSLVEVAEEAEITISAEPVHPGPLADHARAVVSACEGYAQRLETRCEARVKSGRVLSAANRTELEEVLSSLDGVNALRDRVSALLEKARPKQADSETQDATAAKTLTEQLRTQHLRLQHQHRSIAL